MEKILLIVTLAFLYSPISLAASEGDSYGGLQYALVTYDEDDFDELEPTALIGRYGKFVTDNIAIEGRLGIGLQDDSIDVLGIDVDLEVDHLFGVYGVFHANSNSDTSVYGVLGITQGELTVDALGESITDDDSGLSYGFGVNIHSFSIEYMMYLDEDDYEASAISLGFVTSF